MTISVFLIGESFREGGGGCRTTAQTVDGFHDQLLASKTHLAFLRLLEHETKIKPELHIVGYVSNYSSVLFQTYSPFRADYRLLPEPMGQERLLDECRHILATKDKCESIFIIRIDTILKKQFAKIIHCRDRLALGSACWVVETALNPSFPRNHPSCNTPLGHSLHNGRPRATDMIVHIPGRMRNNFVNREFTLSHHTLEHFPDYGPENVCFVLDTYHDSDPMKDRNPLYRLAGRPECPTWHTPGLKMAEDGRPVRCDEATYEAVFGSDELLV